MSKSKLLIRQMAIEDLASIWEQSFLTHSKKDADALYTQLIIQLRKIAQNFTIGKSIESIRDGYREFQIAEFQIYYRADLEHTVEIIRILKNGTS